MERRYYNINELSNYIGIPKGTIYSWVCYRKIPFLKIGRLVKFDIKASFFPLVPVFAKNKLVDDENKILKMEWPDIIRTKFHVRVLQFLST